MIAYQKDSKLIDRYTIFLVGKQQKIESFMLQLYQKFNLKRNNIPVLWINEKILPINGIPSAILFVINPPLLENELIHGVYKKHKSQDGFLYLQFSIIDENSIHNICSFKNTVIEERTKQAEKLITENP